MIAFFMILAMLIAIYRFERGGSGRWTRSGLFGLRILAIGLIVFAIYDWQKHQALIEKSDLIVVVDRSASMSLNDFYDSPQVNRLLQSWLESAKAPKEYTRFDIATSILNRGREPLLSRLAKSYNLRLYSIGESVTPISFENESSNAFATTKPNALSSNLGFGLNEIIQRQRGRTTTAILILTDGNATDENGLLIAAETASRRAIPIFPIGIGDERPVKDIALSNLVCNSSVFAEDAVTVKFSLFAGGFAGKRIKVGWREVESGKIISEKSFRIDSDNESISDALTFRAPSQGKIEYELFSAVAPEERYDENNAITHTIEIREETIKVLLVGDYPSREFHFLKQLFSRSVRDRDRNRSIELKTYLQHGNLEYAGTEETALAIFPVQREQIDEFDVLILVDVDLSNRNAGTISQREMGYVKDFVQKSGKGLIVVAGPHNGIKSLVESSLAPLLPFRSGNATVPEPDQILGKPFSILPTRLGERWSPLLIGEDESDSQKVVRGLPGVYWHVDIKKLKEGVRRLVTHDLRRDDEGQLASVISMQYNGGGKVVFHGTAETYRWRTKGGQSYYKRYWNQLLRFLCNSRLQSDGVKLQTDRETYRKRDPVNFRVEFMDDRLAPENESGVTVNLRRLEEDAAQSSESQLVKLSRAGIEKGLFDGEVNGLEQGRYEARIAEPILANGPSNVLFEVKESSLELSVTRLNSDSLNELAKTTDGKYIQLSSVENIESILPPATQIPLSVMPPESLWSRWQFLLPFALLLTAILTTEWIMRRLAGML